MKQTKTQLNVQTIHENIFMQIYLNHPFKYKMAKRLIHIKTIAQEKQKYIEPHKISKNENNLCLIKIIKHKK